MKAMRCVSRSRQAERAPDRRRLPSATCVSIGLVSALLSVGFAAAGTAWAQTQIHWEIVEVTTSLGSPPDELELGETITIGARLRNPDAEPAVEVVGAFDGYSDSILDFVSADAVDGVLYQACLPGPACVGGLSNLVSTPLSEDATLGGEPFVQVLGAASVMAAPYTGAIDPGLDDVISGDGAQFEVTFLAAELGRTTVVVGRNPTVSGPDSVSLQVGETDEAITDELDIRVVERLCDNGLDDDGDGFIDLQDPGCRDSDDLIETHLRPGDVVVANFDTGDATLFDPTTTRLAPLTIDSGALAPWDIEVDAEGEIHFSDSQLGSLTAVDAEQGRLSIVTIGDQLLTPTGIAQAFTGEWFVADASSDAIFEVDPLTGIQSLLSNDPDFGSIDDLIRQPGTGSLYVNDIASGLHSITDPLGSPSVFSIVTPSVAVGRQMAWAGAITEMVIADSGDNIPARKALAVFGDTPMLSAPAFTNMQGAAYEPSGLSLFSDYATGLISRVDDAADIATPLNVGREEPGINHISMVPAAADLTLSLTDALIVDGGEPGVADIGDQILLKATVTNVGPFTADLLSLESGLDPALTMIAGSLSTTQGTIVEGSLSSDPRLEVDLGSLGAGASATVTWRVVVGDPSPADHATASAWVRREKVILAESDDPTTGPSPDPNVIGVGSFVAVVAAQQKLGDVRGGLSGSGNAGGLLSDEANFSGVAPLGLFDGDAVPDLAVGARGQDGKGAVFVVFLNPDGSVKSSVEIGDGAGDLVLPGSGTRFGETVANLGDVDGDGVDDLAVGAPLDDTGDDDAGAVYVLFLNADGTLKTHARIAEGVGGGPALDPQDNFGQSVVTLGDLNGDGVNDLGVGARRDDDAGLNFGAFYVLLLRGGVGEPDPGTVLGAPIKIAPGQNGFFGPLGGEWFGASGGLLGDLNGDQRPEVAVGCPLDDDGGTDFGAVWILSLRSSAAGDAPAAVGQVFAEMKISAGSYPPLITDLDAMDRFGEAVVGIGDADGDGVEDLAVSAPFDDDGGSDRGAIWLVLLDAGGVVKEMDKISTTTDATVGLTEDSDLFGFRLALLGDLSGDGTIELAAGALLDDDGGANRGSVQLLSLAAPVPEPRALALLASGLAMLAALARRRSAGEGGKAG